MTALSSTAIFSSFTVFSCFYIISFKKTFCPKTLILSLHSRQIPSITTLKHNIQEHGCTLAYLSSGQTDKGELARQCPEQFPDRTRLICAFSVVEPCKTMTLKPNRSTKELEVTSPSTKCKHYYFYYNDKEFGWMFLKIQTWFPYNV